MSPKENKCVACGITSNLSKHSIVPHSYRSHLPGKYKNRTSHDIVLLCQGCQYIIMSTAGPLKKTISQEYAKDIYVIPPKYVHNLNIARIRSAALVLKRHMAGSVTLPENRLIEVQNILKGYYQKDELTIDNISNACNLLANQEIPNENSNNTQISTEDEAIAKYITQQGEQAILDFVIRWRKNFLATLQPSYMPMHWNVNHDFLLPNVN